MGLQKVEAWVREVGRWGGGELGLQIGLPFCCLLGSQMQFIDNMRGTERGDGEQGVPEYRIPLKVSANFMRMRPFCHYVGYLHTHSTHTHTATDVEAVRQKPKAIAIAKAKAGAQNLLHKLWQQILAQTIFSWFRKSQEKGSEYILYWDREKGEDRAGSG